MLSARSEVGLPHLAKKVTRFTLLMKETGTREEKSILGYRVVGEEGLGVRGEELVGCMFILRV